MTQPNPELWSRFIEAVKAGRVEPFQVDGNLVVMSYGDFQVWLGEVSLAHRGVYLSSVDNLCAELRRWMEGKGWHWNNSPTQLSIGQKSLLRTIPKHFNDGTELDRHLAAALWVLEREGAE